MVLIFLLMKTINIERSTNFSYQALWIEILLPNHEKNICGIVYRQHNNADQFLDYLSDSLEYFSNHNNNIYLMGDFNIDLLKYENCKYSQTLLQCMQSFSMLPTTDKPTRVYGSSATLTDNIFTNNLTNNISSFHFHFISAFSYMIYFIAELRARSAPAEHHG